MPSGAGDVYDGVAGRADSNPGGCVFLSGAGSRNGEAEDDAWSPGDHCDVGGVDVVPER